MSRPLTPLAETGAAVNGGPIRASDNTVYLLRSFIFTGRFEAGQKLPPERQLAEELRTSRITVRSALKSLEAFGFVVATIGSRGGWWVVDSASLALCWQNWMHSNHHQIDAMLECAEVIESEMAFLAATRRTPEQLERLKALVSEMEESESSPGPNYAFHQELARACGNQYLQQAMDGVANSMFVPVDSAMAGSMDVFHRVHEDIMTAIADRDPDRAKEAMKAHFRFSRHILEVEE